MAGIRSADLSGDQFVDAGKAAELKVLLHSYENYLVTNHLADHALVFETAVQCRQWCPVSDADVWLEFPVLAQPVLVRRFLDSLPGSRIDTAVLDLPGIEPPRRMKEYGARVRRIPPESKEQ